MILLVEHFVISYLYSVVTAALPHIVYEVEQDIRCTARLCAFICSYRNSNVRIDVSTEQGRHCWELLHSASMHGDLRVRVIFLYASWKHDWTWRELESLTLAGRHLCPIRRDLARWPTIHKQMCRIQIHSRGNDEFAFSDNGKAPSTKASVDVSPCA